MGPPRHIAIAFAANPATPKVSLWILAVATEILDLLCFGLLAARVEHAAPDPWIPWSHGLFMSALWSAAAGGVALAFYKDRRPAAVIGLLIFSHWVMDFVSHSSDLSLLSGRSPLLGLGLEGSLATGFIMEFGLFAAGIAIYTTWRKQRQASSPTM